MVEGFIEPASPEDLEEILAVQKEAFRTEGERYGDFSIPPLLESMKEISHAFEKQVFFKYVVKSEIAGSIRGYIDERGVCLIGRLAVRVNYRRKGIARRLVLHLMEFFKSCREFEIFTGENSLPALTLYESLGFVRKEIKNAGSHKVVIMTKKNSS